MNEEMVSFQFSSITFSYISTLISPTTSFIASANIDGTYLVTDKTACMTGVRDYPELRFEGVTEESKERIEAQVG